MSALSWPPQRFYWALVDAGGWRRTGPAPPGLAASLADEVPVPTGELHAVCAPLTDGRVVVCAASREDLAELPPETDALCPAGLPECIDTDAAVAGRLNLLVGEFEPRRAGRDRLRRHVIAAAALTLCATLVACGLLRRAERWDRTAEQTRSAGVRIMDAVAPGGDSSLLAAELARARRLTHPGTSLPEPVDAVAALAAVLRGWPTAVPSSPQSLDVTGASAVISVNVSGDPAAFLSALKPPPGWALDEPRLNSAGGTTRLSLVMRPVKQGDLP